MKATKRPPGLLGLRPVGLLVAQPRHAADHVDGDVLGERGAQRDALDQAAEPCRREPHRLEDGRQGIVHRDGDEQGLHGVLLLGCVRLIRAAPLGNRHRGGAHTVLRPPRIEKGPNRAR